MTGAGSHVLRREAGVGNLYIGPRAQRASTPQAIVRPDERLHWAALDAIPRRGAYAWPRWLEYEGQDSGIFDWLSRRRETLESLELVATAPLSVDASHARLQQLRVETKYELRLVAPGAVDLSLHGTLEHMDVTAAARGADVELTLEPRRGRLVALAGLAGVKRLTVRGSEVDLTAIGDFAEVRELSLIGTMKNLPALRELHALEHFTLRDVWNLAELPPWPTWPSLKEVNLFGARKSDAKRLVQAARRSPTLAIRARGSRTDAWIEDPTNRPRFEGWSVPARALKEANAAYATAEAACSRLCTPTPARADRAQARAIVEELVRALNALHARKGCSLTTLEREDAVDAIDALFSREALAPLRDDALAWFDASRSF